MNYERIYKSIIQKRKDTPPVGYSERHHIIPKSLGGTDTSDNLIQLTAREHFLCHYCLAKMYPKESLEWYKTNHAFMMMKCGILNGKRYYNSRLYENLKKNFSDVMRYTQIGVNNSQYGTRWISNETTQTSIRIQKNIPIPTGWVAGRYTWKRTEYKTQIQENKQTRNDKKREEAETLWSQFVQSGCKSLREFVRLGHYQHSVVNLSTKLSKHLPNYKELINRSYSING